MAVSVDVAGVDINNGAGAVSPLTGTGPSVTAAATCILVYYWNSNTFAATSIKWGSQNLTQLVVGVSTGFATYCEIWGGVVPTTGAQTITAAWSGGSAGVDVVAVSYKGSA